MATQPPMDPQPDTGPSEMPQPTTPPSEIEPIPGDIDMPSPAEQPGTGPEPLQA